MGPTTLLTVVRKVHNKFKLIAMLRKILKNENRKQLKQRKGELIANAYN